ncbi:hypothetical protein VN97_g10211 [Penicillium thymicola]|uniref:Uncharacterized protein n=1 Tax=Penicillium thymicola TaxID=293382 RepID=A0AAI9T9H5_PENTH|nr:hypothetical protein VN97_g10211 [Penicillium thymicola]
MRGARGSWRYIYNMLYHDMIERSACWMVETKERFPLQTVDLLVDASTTSLYFDSSGVLYLDEDTICFTVD